MLLAINTGRYLAGDWAKRSLVSSAVVMVTQHSQMCHLMNFAKAHSIKLQAKRSIDWITSTDTLLNHKDGAS